MNTNDFQLPPLQGVELEAYMHWISFSENIDITSIEQLTGELLDTLYPYAEYSVFTLFGSLMKEYLPTLSKKDAAKVMVLCRAASDLIEGTLVGKKSNDWLAAASYRGMWHTYADSSQFRGLIPGGSAMDEILLHYCVRVVTVSYPVVADASQKINQKNRAKLRKAWGSMVRICFDAGQADWEYAPLMILIGHELKSWIEKPVHTV